MKKLALATIALASLIGLGACNQAAPAKKTPAGEELMLAFLKNLNPRQKEFTKGQLSEDGTEIIVEGDYYGAEDDMLDTGNEMFFTIGLWDYGTGDDEADITQFFQDMDDYQIIPDSVVNNTIYEGLAELGQRADSSWYGVQMWYDDAESCLLRALCEMYTLSDGTTATLFEVDSWTLPKGFLQDA